MVYEEIEELPSRNLSLQRWKVLRAIMDLGIEGAKDSKKDKRFIAIHVMLLTVSIWPSDIESDLIDYSCFVFDCSEEN